MSWLDIRTPFLFFTGKGGVGKTTVASATALRLAESGRRVLIVSTDPASNLDDVFGIEVSTAHTPVPEVASLHVMNIDPEAVAAAHRERMVAPYRGVPYRGVLPDAVVRSMEEQFSGACAVEIAAFNEFTALLADPREVRSVRRRARARSSRSRRGCSPGRPSRAATGHSLRHRRDTGGRRGRRHRVIPVAYHGGSGPRSFGP